MITLIKPKRSISLSEDELDKLKYLRDEFPTEVEMALRIGIDRNVLARVIQVGSGSPSTVSKIRRFLKRKANVI